MTEFLDLDSVSHSWRWWAAMGSALAIWPVGKWLATFDPKTTPYFSDTVRWVDGRIAGFTQESRAFRGGMAAAWLMWGLCAWITAIGFAKNRRAMMASAVLWWWAVWFALRETAGAML